MQYTPDDWLRAGHFITIEGQTIFCIEAGNGPTMVLLHGFPTSSWDWQKIWLPLAGRFRVLAFDFPGFGFSDKPRHHTYSMVGQADLTEELLRVKGITGYHLLAHDIGDTVALELLARQADRQTDHIQSVCLLNGGLFPETHHALPIQRRLLGPWGRVLSRLVTGARFRKSLSALFAPSTQPSPDEYNAYWQLMSHKQGQRNLHKLIRYITERRQNRDRWVGSLQRTRVPIRLIAGLADPVSGAHMILRYRELIHRPDIVALPGIGHYPQVEAPEALLQALFAFYNHR